MGKGSRKKAPTHSSDQPSHWALKGVSKRYQCGKAKPKASSQAVEPHEPDRGTVALQAKRAAAGGDRDQPVVLADPIDVLHRGKGRLTHDQALAAVIWRSRSALIIRGDGPRLAMLREPDGNIIEPDEERVAQAREELERLERAIRRHGRDVYEAALGAVVFWRYPRSVYLLQVGLSAAADALRLHQKR